MDTIEFNRLSLQKRLDSEKTRLDRNRLGQFATPTVLAKEILQYSMQFFSKSSGIKFLDPAVGTGSFVSSLFSVFPSSQIKKVIGYEIDPHYADDAIKLWEKHKVTYRIEDFTKASPIEKFNLLVCNPPYVRHQHLSPIDKKRLQIKAGDIISKRVDGLSSLYVYFMAIAHEWMEENGVAIWLIPSEFMTVNYGRCIKEYLIKNVTLLHIHRFDPNDVQFDDALVTSAIVVFKKERTKPDHKVKFSFGGTLLAPNTERSISFSELRSESKWSQYAHSAPTLSKTAPVLSDFFKISRGLATGENSFFILNPEEIKRHGLPVELFKPILPPPRKLKQDIVESDSNGLPLVADLLFLLDTSLNEEQIKLTYPQLWNYLEEGISKGLNLKYLCAHRHPWYSQEKRPFAPIVCTYIGRSDNKTQRPFRFIMNESTAVVSNSYLAMYPKGELEAAIRSNPTILKKVWKILNEIDIQQLIDGGRVYGGGLHKLEPKELSNIAVPQLHALITKH